MQIDVDLLTAAAMAALNIFKDSFFVLFRFVFNRLTLSVSREWKKPTTQENTSRQSFE